MSLLAATNPTLIDVAKRLDPNGKIADIAEVLAAQNEVLQDLTMVEANGLASHRTTVRSGLPDVTWRKLNYGVQPSKSRTVQVTDNVGMLEAYAEIDKDLYSLNGNSAEWRFSEEVPFIEAMNQELASTIFYGNEGTAPAEFTGLAPRFNSQTAENGANILTSAATPDSTDNTSIWLVVWSPNTVHMIYPKGSKAGLQVTDHGEQTILDAAGGRFQAMRTHYKWNCGLSVRDWRYVVRINYDLENIVASAATGPDLFQLMGQAMRRIPMLSIGRPVFYANRDSLDALDLQANARSQLAYGNFEDATGKLVTKFRGIPVRRCDAILSTEAGI
jgi:hypothetical protein